MSKCRAELCVNWSGDGDVCPCAVLGMQPFTPDAEGDDWPEGIERTNDLGEAGR